MLYRTTPIRDPGEAQRLPVGTIARFDEEPDSYLCVLRLRDGERIWESYDAGALRDADMVGWTALVLAPDQSADAGETGEASAA
ncbi:hypothetical protein [Brachybacterium hainanense]|uniref:DUF4926 domain-containing protein n=1 Tax=Brachybacterium hainanense TaxID=1541174 RepID=A0ABV6RCL3_9MICO